MDKDKREILNELIDDSLNEVYAKITSQIVNDIMETYSLEEAPDIIVAGIIFGVLKKYIMVNEMPKEKVIEFVTAVTQATNNKLMKGCTEDETYG